MNNCPDICFIDAHSEGYSSYYTLEKQQAIIKINLLDAHNVLCGVECIRETENDAVSRQDTIMR